MGYNIQSDEFWELRPDNFSIMSAAFDKKQEMVWLPFRRLMTVIAAANGNTVPEEDFAYLPSIDSKKENKNLAGKAIVLSKKEIEEITKEHIKNGSIKANSPRG